MSTTGTSRRNLLRTGRASVAAAAVGLSAQLLITPIVIHTLGLRQYGVYVVLSSLIVFGGLLDFGVRSELTRRVASARGRDDWAAASTAVNDGASTLLALGILVFMLGASLTPLLVNFSLGAGAAVSHPRLLLLIMILLVSCGFVVDSRGAALAGLQRNDVLQKLGIVTTALRLVLVVVLIRVERSVWMLVVAQVVSSLTGWLLVVVQLRRLAPALVLKVRWFRLAVMRGLLAGSFLLVASQVSDVVDYNLDRVIISHYLGINQAAQYSVGIQLPLTLRALALIPASILIAAVAELKGTQDERLNQIVDAATRIILGLGVVAMAGVIALAPGFYENYLGTGYDLAARAAQLLAVATFINLCSAGWSLFAVGSGWYTVIGWAAGTNVVINGTLSYVLIRTIGYEGSLYGSMAGSAIGVGVLYLNVRTRERRPWLRPVLPAVVAAVLAGTVCGFLSTVLAASNWLVLTAQALAVTIGCLAVLVLLRVLSPGLLHLLRKPALPSAAP